MKAKEQSIGYTNKLQSTIKSLTRVEGCCKALKPLVPITNSEAIMKLMLDRGSQHCPQSLLIMAQKFNGFIGVSFDFLEFFGCFIPHKNGPNTL